MMIAGHHGPCDEGVIRAGAPDTPCSAIQKRWVLAASVLGSSLAFLLGSVVNVALPTVQAAFEADAASIQWVLNAFLLTLGALVLLGGAAGDRYGRRRMFLWGIGIFTVATLACAFAPGVGWLIAARAVAGVGAAFLVPNSLALISSVFPEHERGRAIGTWASFSALTTALGPALGGLLADSLGWRSVFAVVLPLAVAAFAIGLRHVPESRQERRDPLDLPGAVLVTGGLGAAIWGLVALAEAGIGDRDARVALILGALLLIAFLVREGRTRYPMLPLGLFGSIRFSSVNLLTFLLYFALTGALFLLPFLMIDVLGYSASASGLAFLPLTLPMAFLSRWAGGITDRFSPRVPLVAGPALAAAGYFLLAARATSSGPFWTTLLPGLLLVGLGMTIAVPPLTSVVLGAVDEQRAGVASSVNNAAARLASLVAIAVVGGLAVVEFRGSLESRLSASPLPATVQASILARSDALSALTPGPETPRPQRGLVEDAVDGAFSSAFERAVGLTALAALGAAGLGLLSGPPRASSASG